MRTLRWTQMAGRVLAFGIVLICVSLANADEPPAGTAPPPAAIPFELQPYRLRVSVAFAESAHLEPALCRGLLEQFPVTADRLIGDMWSIQAEQNTWLVPGSAGHLAELNVEQLPSDWHQEAFDKFYLLTLESVGGEYVLSGREWDPIGRLLGHGLTRHIVQRRELDLELFRLVHDLFRPRLQIERITDGIAAITVQGGALTPADPTFRQLRQGQFWQPFMRYRNLKGVVEKHQSIPWTLLQISEINPDNPAHAQARVISGLRSALPNRRRPRIDVLARAVEPVAEHTELRLVSRQTPSQALVGVVIDARAKADGPVTRYMTDRNGTVRIPTQTVDPLLWLTIRSGEKTLARLPVVPGMEAELTAELPDDSIRLRVEGELSILESNLTDTVAQRAVLVSRIRRSIQLGDWKSANELRTELKLLPVTDAYLKQLNAIRIPAHRAALAVKDKATAAYIDRACDEVSKIIQKFLDEEKLKALDEEWKELERAAGSEVKKGAS